jgi:4-hydroxybenzoate polyprenyltransferase
MRLQTALRLGRVSNLPTVWTNVAAAIVLAGGVPHAHTVALLALAASLFYVGGMFLNDVYDAEVDALERPERPIPAGEVDREVVGRWGYGLLGAGLVVIAGHGLALGTVPTWRALLAGVATCAVIVAYDRWHKGNPAAPVIMGLCRVGVYVTAALAVAPSLSPALLVGAILLLGYVLGLTYVARHENESVPSQNVEASGKALRARIRRWWPLAGLLAPALYMVPILRGTLIARALLGGFCLWIYRALELLRRGEPPAIRGAVVSLIAGISLLDALLLIRHDQLVLALLAVAAFGLTSRLQRHVPGT